MRVLAIVLGLLSGAASAGSTQVADIPDGTLVPVPGGAPDAYDAAGNWAYFTTARYAVLNWHGLHRFCPALLPAQAKPKFFIPAAAMKLRLQVLRGTKVEFTVTSLEGVVLSAAELARCHGIAADGKGTYKLRGQEVVILKDWRPHDD